jgi:hypothetical protein
MIRGDYKKSNGDEKKLYWQIFGYLLTIFANALLLNLIVAIMSDAFEEVITSQDEKNLKQQNFLILRCRAFDFR